MMAGAAAGAATAAALCGAGCAFCRRGRRYRDFAVVTDVVPGGGDAAGRDGESSRQLRGDRDHRSCFGLGRAGSNDCGGDANGTDTGQNRAPHARCIRRTRIVVHVRRLQ